MVEPPIIVYGITHLLANKFPFKKDDWQPLPAGRMAKGSGFIGTINRLYTYQNCSYT